jgi:glutamate/tyrosine decarboxylase-like PLP-dependent enzyme
MFDFDDDAQAIADLCTTWVRGRVDNSPPIGPPVTPHDLDAALGATVTKDGIGAAQAMRLFADHIAPAAIALDSPRHAALMPGAPTMAATLFDACVSASALVAEAWIEAAGAIAAENQALRWLADLAGLPADAGGCFVSGGTAGNFSALAVARDAHGAGRTTVAVGADAHSSVARTLHVLGLNALVVPSDDRARLTGAALAEALAATHRHEHDVFAVVATAGATNAGSIDDLAGVAAVARDRGLWLHIDAAYGGAALCAPSVRDQFVGIEHADSLIIDPHKWLFAPLDCCALLYREPERARHVHRQVASYLEPMRTEGEWDPADYALHLTRRARGLPFWFSLATYGTDAYRDAVELSLTRAREAARRVDDAPHVELLVEPELSVLLFRRPGWSDADYVQWSQQLLDDGTAFVLPTRWHGETVARFVFLHPKTTIELFDEVLAAMT